MADMKTRLFVYTLLLLLLVQLHGEQTVVRFDLNPPYFNAIPATNRVLQLQPLTPFRGNMLTYTSDASGLVFASNLWVGTYEGKILPRGLAQEIRFTISITATNLGLVNAHEITSVVGAPTYPVSGATAWSIQASDARYARAGAVGAAGITNALPPLERQNQTVALTNATLMSLTTNQLRGPLNIGEPSFAGQLALWDDVNVAYRQILLSGGNFQFEGPLRAEAFSGHAGSLTNGSALLATNGATAPDGFVLARAGNRLRLEERATLAQATNIAEWLIVTSSVPNAVYVSASRGTLNGQRNNPARPFATLAIANDAAQLGDTIIVLDGTFIETLQTKTGVSYWFNNGTRVTPQAGQPYIAVAHSGRCRIAGSVIFTNVMSETVAIVIQSSNAELQLDCAVLSAPDADALLDGQGTNVVVSIRADVIDAPVLRAYLPKGVFTFQAATIRAAELSQDNISIENSTITDLTQTRPVTNRLTRCRLIGATSIQDGLLLADSISVTNINFYVPGRFAGTALVFPCW